MHAAPTTVRMLTLEGLQVCVYALVLAGPASVRPCLQVSYTLLMHAVMLMR
jgi:hypothetical protein